MKLLLFLLLFVSNQLLSQNNSDCWQVDSSKKREFLQNLPMNNGLYVIKTNLIDNEGNLYIRMVFKYQLESYLEFKFGISKDSVNKFILNSILTQRKFPLVDSVYLQGAFVNQQLLNNLNSMPFAAVLNKYFKKNGQIKDEYEISMLDAISCYLFDKAIIFGYSYSGDNPASINPFYLGKLKAMKCAYF